MQLLNILVLQMWDKFLVYKDRVNNCLNVYKVDPALRQEYMEQLTMINNSKSMLAASSVSGGYSRPDEQALASIYAKRFPLYASGESGAQKYTKTMPLAIPSSMFLKIKKLTVNTYYVKWFFLKKEDIMEKWDR